MKKCPRCTGHNIVSVQYLDGKNKHDGISEWKCYDCGYRRGRWCGKELHDSEEEPILCSGRAHPRIIKL